MRGEDLDTAMLEDEIMTQVKIYAWVARSEYHVCQTWLGDFSEDSGTRRILLPGEWGSHHDVN